VTRPPPDWLEDFQARFGATLRTPLDRASGTLTATPDAYDAALAARAVRPGRLAVYNRQYWFRLFEALQGAFPLTARLLGFWEFNGHAARFLLERPPRSWDLDRAADGFEAFFDPEHHEAAERDALREAARIDAAWRRVRRAPAAPAWRPSPADAERLPTARLVPSPAVVFVTETRPLLELRATLRDEPRVELPPPLPRARSWAVVRRDEGIARFPLEAREAELLELLAGHALSDALAQLESACSDDERAALPEQTRAWLARSVERGDWAGLA
jgi:hypothetical protein